MSPTDNVDILQLEFCHARGYNVCIELITCTPAKTNVILPGTLVSYQYPIKRGIFASKIASFVVVEFAF